MKGSTKKAISLLTVALMAGGINVAAKAESNGVQDSARNTTSITLNKPVEGADEVYTAPTGTNVVFFKQSNGKVVVLTLTALTTEQQAQLQADLLASHTDSSIKEDDQFYYIVGEGTYNLKEMLDDKAWGTEYIVEVSDEGIITITYQDGKISHYTPFCVVTPTPTLSPSPTPTPFEPTPTPFEPTPTPFEPTPTPFEPTPTPFEPTPTPEQPTPTVFITPTPEVTLTPTPGTTNTPGVTPTLPPEPPKTGVDFGTTAILTGILITSFAGIAVIPSSKFEGRRRVRK